MTVLVRILLCGLLTLSACDTEKPRMQPSSTAAGESEEQWIQRSQDDFKRWFESPLNEIEDLTGGCRAWTDAVSCEFFFRSSSQVRLKWQESYKTIRCGSISSIIERFTEWKPRIADLTCNQRGAFNKPGPASGLVWDPISDSYLFWASYSSAHPPEENNQ